MKYESIKQCKEAYLSSKMALLDVPEGDDDEMLYFLQRHLENIEELRRWMCKEIGENVTAFPTGGRK